MRDQYDQYDQYDQHDITKRVIDKVFDDFKKQGIKLGIKQAKYDAAIAMIKQNVPVDEIERITGVTLQTKFPEECMPNSTAAKHIKKGFDSGLILGREEIIEKKGKKKEKNHPEDFAILQWKSASQLFGGGV